MVRLTYAKLQCERRLKLLGVGAPLADSVRSSTSTLTSTTSPLADDVVAPSLKTVVRQPGLRKQLELYLSQQVSC